MAEYVVFPEIIQNEGQVGTKKTSLKSIVVYSTDFKFLECWYSEKRHLPLLYKTS